MNELATFRANGEQLNNIVEKGAGGYHEDLLFRVNDDGVETLMQTNQRQVVSYCSWEESYFKAVSGECEAIVPVGGSSSDSTGFLDYMDFAGSGTVEITLLRDEEADAEGEFAPLATHLRAEGALNTLIRLPSSDDDLDAVPWDHPVRWTPTEEYVSKTCLTDEGELPEDEDEWVTGPVVIETSAAIIDEKIINPASFVDGVEYRPITVEDGAFVLNVTGNQQDDEIWGEVNAERVEGPDVEREFHPDSFDPVVGSMQGNVRLQTAPDGSGGDVAPPATIVQEKANHTVRHLIGALVER